LDLSRIHLPTIRVNSRAARAIRGGRRWVYATDVEEFPPAAPGSLVRVVYGRRQVATGYFHPRSMIAVRVLTEDPDEEVDADLFARRIREAWRRRERLLPTLLLPGGQPEERLRACRVVFGEADFLPALICDRFGEVLVVQLLALGLEPWREPITDALARTLKPGAIYERSDAPVRELEGLPRVAGLRRGSLPERVEIVEYGVRFQVDVERGQKTGHFLDQQENRVRVRELARGKRVLDAFAYTGGFGLHAARAGAREVLALDLSAEALELARENARLNGVEGRIAFRQANAFDELRRLEKLGERFDLGVLDPPPFARSREALPGAYRGYKEINLRAMRLLVPGGILVTCSCSYHMTADLFLQCVREAAWDTNRRIGLIERRGAAPDHPVLLGAEESDYLKCLILEVRPPYWSLVPQGHDGVEPRGLPGRVHPEEEAHGHGQAESRYHCRGDDEGDGAYDAGDPPGRTKAQSHPHESPGKAQKHRLGEELAQDVARPGSHRHADAYLPGALGDRDQHDVHDSDSPHQEGDAGHRTEK